MMKKLILVRHGQSLWNLEKRFTGWVDVDLAANGKLEACKSGELLKDNNINIDYSFSSLQISHHPIFQQEESFRLAKSSDPV